MQSKKVMCAATNMDKSVFKCPCKQQALAVQRADNFIHQTNPFSADKMHSNKYILNAG